LLPIYFHGKLLDRQSRARGESGSMDYLSDSLLMEAYEKAVELNLDFDFIHLIQEEINKRTSEEALIKHS
jgi:hypothetical protein